jgi:hypothetical protein
MANLPEERPQVVVNTPSQGVTAVAGETIGALSGSPILLVMVLLNLGFLGSAAWYFHQQQIGTERVITQIMDRCLPAAHGDAYILPEPSP